jgi:hypothetical protein
MMAGNLSHEEEMKRYLFRELSQTEMERFEEKLFEDGDYFYDVLGLEDDLVDRYALGKLSGTDLERFERSLRDSSGRREKVAGAVALQRHIAEEKRAGSTREAAAEVRVAGASLWERLASLFSLPSPALRYAAVGLMLLLTFGFVFLAAERFRLGRELARLHDSESQRSEELQKQIAAASEREAELRRQLESESGKSQVLNEQLEGESAERERLQRELEMLRHERGDATTPTAIASVFLMAAGRGSGGAQPLTVSKNVGRIAIGLELEDGLSPDARFNVEINGRAIATGVRPKRAPSGKLLVTVTVPAGNVSEGLNKIVLKNESNLPVGDYELNVRRR